MSSKDWNIYCMRTSQTFGAKVNIIKEKGGYFKMSVGNVLTERPLRASLNQEGSFELFFFRSLITIYNSLWHPWIHRLSWKTHSHVGLFLTGTTAPSFDCVTPTFVCLGFDVPWGRAWEKKVKLNPDMDNIDSQMEKYMSLETKPSSSSQIASVTLIWTSGQSADAFSWCLPLRQLIFLLFLSVLKHSLVDMGWGKKNTVLSLQQLQVCSTLHPRTSGWDTVPIRRAEFLLFPSNSVEFAHSEHSEWPRLVFGVRGSQSSERFSWLYPGSDSCLPAEGWEDVCICFPSVLV